MSSQSDPAPSPVPVLTGPRWDGPSPAPAIDVTVAVEDAATELARLLAQVTPADHEAHGRASRHLARLATPPGALGHLANLALELACLTGHPPPVPSRPALLLAAGDHGVHRHGVTPWAQSTTRRLAEAALAGRAGVSTAARTVGARVCVLDVGLVQPIAAHPALVVAPVVRGTGDLHEQDAMSVVQARRALLLGARLAAGLMADGADLLVLGDLGVGNATASEALVAATTGVDPDYLTGRPVNGAAEHVAVRQQVLRTAIRRVGLRSPLQTLAGLGGAEHAALVGAILAAAGRRVPVLLDGLADAAAALIAVGLAPDAGQALIVGSVSPEPAARIAVGHLGLRPLLDLDVRLGDGTGALLAVPAVQAAARLLHDVATLEEAGLAT